MKKRTKGSTTNSLLLIVAVGCLSTVFMTYVATQTNQTALAVNGGALARHLNNEISGSANPRADKAEAAARVEVDGTQISNSELVSWMLSGNDKDVGTQHKSSLQMIHSPKAPLHFKPGTLTLSHANTLAFCYADPQVYRGHLQQGGGRDGSSVRVSYSDKHKLVYVMLPKSGSSTARYHLKNDFDASETHKSLQHLSFEKNGDMYGVEVMTFVRDPLTRFYSQYEEAFVRTAPWEGKKKHPFPFIHAGMSTYHEYEDVFCPPNTRHSRKDCIFRPSQENGTLVERFERFVREWDGLTPFDVHLTLQVPLMSTSDGMALHMTQIYNTTDAKNAWKRIAEKYGVQLGAKGVIEGRSYPRRFRSELVSKSIQRRICELTLLDYCCLNLPLPETCQGNHYKGPNGEQGQELSCQLHRNRIVPGIYPSK